MNETSNYKAKPEHVTPHQVASIASKLRPADAKVLYALKNQMIDDIQMRVMLRRMIESMSKSNVEDGWILVAPQYVDELLKVIDTAMGAEKAKAEA